MPNQNTLLYLPLTFRILAVAIFACLFLAPKAMADTKDQEYIVLISSSTFREKWAYDLLEIVEKAFNEENSVKVYSETLTTWHFNNQQEINQKVDYLKDKYSVPPQAVIFVGDPGWYVCKPLFDTIWKGVPTIICHSMPHTSADINKYYNGEYIPEDQIIATPEMLERYNVTAINIPVCIKETIELMKEITPEMKKVVLLSDDRFICSLIRKKAEDIHQQYFSDLDMEFITYPQTNTETMLRIISECGKETGIIYCSWVNVASQNLSEKYYPDERMHSYISGIVKKPVFSLSDQFTRVHALFAGGHYIGSSDVESTVIGEIRSALKKDGTYEAKTVVAGTPNTYLNYQTLLDKGVPLDNFPKNAVYCDVPPSFIQKNIIYVVIVLGTAIVLLLFYFMHKRIKKVRETEWQEHLHLLENILDNLPIAAKVKDVDNDMRYTFINKKAEELFEYPAKEAIGRTDFDIMPEAATMIRKEDEELVRTGIAQSGTRRFFTNKNEERFTFQNNNIVSFSDGRKWILYTAWDITDQKILERKLRLAKEEAEESNRIKSAFLANMSHEIRTPLNAIVGFSSILADAEEPEEKEEYINIIENNNTLLLQLVGDILYLSKIESGTLEFVYSDIDLNALFQELEESARLRQKNDAVVIRYLPEMPDCFVNIEKNRLTQVVTNMMNNAMKFTPSGRITFGYHLKNTDFLYFYITDTGYGIEKDKKDTVFGRFVKLDSFSQGTGLGLSICQSIVENLGGEIGVESEPGKGSTFWFTLPYRPVELKSVREQKEHRLNKVESKLTVLIAEDNESNFLLFESILKRQYNILHAWDGEEAVELFKQYNPHLILMDINMPKKTGYEATQLIREMSPTVPIMAVTAYVYAEDEERILNSGFDAYTSKPINAQKLQSDIVDLLKKQLIFM